MERPEGGALTGSGDGGQGRGGRSSWKPGLKVVVEAINERETIQGIRVREKR